MNQKYSSTAIIHPQLMSTSSIAHLYRSSFNLELKQFSRVNIFSSSSVAKDHAVCALSAAIADVRAWLILYNFKFNDSSTEFIVIDTCQLLSKVDISSVKAGSSDIAPSTSVRNLGAWFDVKF